MFVLSVTHSSGRDEGTWTVSFGRRRLMEQCMVKHFKTAEEAQKAGIAFAANLLSDAMADIADEPYEPIT